jgi:probable phosphoglycerate mutase
VPPVRAGAGDARDHAVVKKNFQGPFTAPDGAREVILVRHGSVDPPTPDGLIDGRSDPPLNEAGCRQAAAVAQRLASERVAALFVTPLRRTSETAAAMRDDHAVEPVVLPQLTEIYLGEWEGHGVADRGARADPEFVRVMAEERWDLIPGCEPLDDFAARVREGLDLVARGAGDGSVAIAVTHAGVIAEICRQITGSTAMAFIHGANGSLTRVVLMPDGRWLLLSFGDIAHLGNG